jgi:hypothetical protein
MDAGRRHLQRPPDRPDAQGLLGGDVLDGCGHLAYANATRPVPVCSRTPLVLWLVTSDARLSRHDHGLRAPDRG